MVQGVQVQLNLGGESGGQEWKPFQDWGEQVGKGSLNRTIVVRSLP